MVNGTSRHFGHEHSHGTWTDSSMDVTWPMKAGDTFWVEYSNPGNYAYHSGNPHGAHSRLRVTYMGSQ